MTMPGYTQQDGKWITSKGFRSEKALNHQAGQKQ